MSSLDLYDKSHKCPVCKNEFTTKRVKKSKIRIEKRDTDYFTHYKSENPIYYAAVVCPQCGYSAMDEKFEKLNSRYKDIIREKVYSVWTPRHYSGVRNVEDTIESYKLALYCGNLSNMKLYEMADICLRITWMYKIAEDAENQKKYMKLTAELFKTSFSKEDISRSGMDELSVAYLIGELNRRLGNIKEASSWFAKVLSNPNVKNNTVLENMARDQWLLVKQQIQRYKERMKAKKAREQK